MAETPLAAGTITGLDVLPARPGRTAKDGAGFRAEEIRPSTPIPAQVGDMVTLIRPIRQQG